MASTINEYAGRMAELARALRLQSSAPATMQQVVTATSEMIKGCDDVAISLVADGKVETRASLGNGLAEKADELQAFYQEGPCIETAWDSPLVMAKELPVDGLWARWSAAVSDELSLRSLICVQLFTHENHELGALQVLSTRPFAFDDDAAAELMGIAAQAAVALGAVMNFESLQFGLVRRTMIGQATGILMERYGLNAHQAFEVLRRSSQETGRKVYDLAIELVSGGRPAGL